MSSQPGNWMIALGAVGGVVGILMLPAALGQHPDPSLMVLGAFGMSLGSLIAASGIYLKARALHLPGKSVRVPAESKNSARRVRGGCDVCLGDLPVIHCKVHQVHLCSNCLGRHYDFRTCAYAPSTRGANGKTAAKARAASAR
ncbi:MAG: hypothetical protein ACRD20_13995 [Terriglobales bacterium]